MIGTFDVRVELADVMTIEELRTELTSCPDHRLHPFDPRLTTNCAGRVEVELLVSGTDVWTVVLTVMALFADMSVGLYGLHVELPEAEERCAA